MRSIWHYLMYMLRRDFLRDLFFVKTAPLEEPLQYRSLPNLTGRGCTHCYLCMMICPTPGAIEVLKTGMPAVWNPKISPAHCIRCGLCVEICPEIVLDSGRVYQMGTKSETFWELSLHILINPIKCQGCGSCVHACPVNHQIDLISSLPGTYSSDDLIMRVDHGLNHLMHEEECTGCKTCEEVCSSDAITVARILEARQMVYDEG